MVQEVVNNGESQNGNSKVVTFSALKPQLFVEAPKASDAVLFYKEAFGAEEQLYLAGNQITSLVSLAELPNLEFLSVAQNRLKSLSMASQPRLQVLAASKNKLTTLKDFPHLPTLEAEEVEAVLANAKQWSYL